MIITILAAILGAIATDIVGEPMWLGAIIGGSAGAILTLLKRVSKLESRLDFLQQALAKDWEQRQAAQRAEAAPEQAAEAEFAEAPSSLESKPQAEAIESAVAEEGVCRVTAVTTHPPVGDRVTIWIGIPMEGWNGRFMGNGGGGFSGGNANGINNPVLQGYAAGSTDAGHEGASGSFALTDAGRLDWQSIRNFAHVGIHEMTVTGKALTEALYGQSPLYSYWNG